MKVLIVEDEQDLSEVLSAYLEHNEYTVDTAENGKVAVEKAAANAYDVIVMDIMMPVMDGITALREIRGSGNLTPVLMLTAKTEVGDRIGGLDAGADDYLTKPFAMGELLARLRSLTRRRNQYVPDKLSIGDTSLEVSTGTLVSVNSIRLANQENRLLQLFMLNPDRDFTCGEIYEKVWDKGEEGIEIVDMYVSFLQDKLKSVGATLVIEKRDDKYAIRLSDNR